jgi:hypothetical protein
MEASMSTGDKVPDKAIDKAEIDEAIKMLMQHVDIDNEHWIPYLGGYSNDWDNNPEVYFDARFPDTLRVGGKEMKPYRYILIHECVEKCLMDELKLSYVIAHTFATAAEKSAVEADGFNWDMYTMALKGPIKEVLKKPENLEAPKDLDISPYEQEKSKLVKKIEATTDNLSS